MLAFLVVDRCRSRTGQFLQAGCGRKPKICSWNCPPICHSSRSISNTGFDVDVDVYSVVMYGSETLTFQNE